MLFVVQRQRARPGNAGGEPALFVCCRRGGAATGAATPHLRRLWHVSWANRLVRLVTTSPARGTCRRVAGSPWCSAVGSRRRRWRDRCSGHSMRICGARTGARSRLHGHAGRHRPARGAAGIAWVTAASRPARTGHGSGWEGARAQQQDVAGARRFGAPWRRHQAISRRTTLPRCHSRP